MEIIIYVLGIAALTLLGVGIANNSKTMVYCSIALIISSIILYELDGIARLIGAGVLLVAATIVFFLLRKNDY